MDRKNDRLKEAAIFDVEWTIDEDRS